MPENTLPSFAAAIALGADEIEFDVRLTSDLKMIVCHDGDVNRVSDRKGDVGSYDLETLMRCNAGSYLNWYVGFCTPEQIIERYAGRVVMNIHIAEFHPDYDVPAELRRLLYHYGQLIRHRRAAARHIALHGRLLRGHFFLPLRLFFRCV